MKVVTRFEANLLEILHCFLRRAPLEPTLPLLAGQCAQPRKLTRSAVALIQDTLAKGCVLYLSRAGGWRPERHLSGGQVARGRLWERTPPAELGLIFSRHSLEFLIWITASKPVSGKCWQAPAEELTVADWLLLHLAYGILRETDLFPAVRDRPVFVGNPLCQLHYPEDFADLPFDFNPTYELWTTGLGASILEALQPVLARRWLQAERDKRRISDWRIVVSRGASQRQALEPFCQSAATADRFDLVRFLLEASAQLLEECPTASGWVGRINFGDARMADRTSAYEAALLLPRQLIQFRQWQRRARAVAYFDEGFAAAELTKAEWERWSGEEIFSRAQAIIREVEPLAA